MVRIATQRQLSLKETAAVVHTKLEDAFPSARFAVRATGRDAITLRWTDGPSAQAVWAAALPEFDPETGDLAPIDLDGERVRLADHQIHLRRTMSPAVAAELKAAAPKGLWKGESVTSHGVTYQLNGSHYGDADLIATALFTRISF